MANFDGGVSGYIWGECVVKTHFPIDLKGNAEINCFQCKFLAETMVFAK